MRFFPPANRINNFNIIRLYVILFSLLNETLPEMILFVFFTINLSRYSKFVEISSRFKISLFE